MCAKIGNAVSYVGIKLGFGVVATMMFGAGFTSNLDNPDAGEANPIQESG